MNDLGPLLPPRATPPRLPDRGGPGAVVTAARARRRKRSARVVQAGSALSLMFLGVIALRGPAGTHGIVEDPARTPRPSASSGLTTESPRPPVLGGVLEGPSGSPSATAPTVRPSGPGSPTSRPPTVLPTPGQPGDGARYVPVTRTMVPFDYNAGECTPQTYQTRPDIVVCIEPVAPVETPSGMPANLGLDACAAASDVTVHADSHQEAGGIIEDAADAGNPVWTVRERPNGLGAHDFVIPAGQCVRYVFHWDGLGDDGRPLPPGSYSFVTAFAGGWNVGGGGHVRIAFRVT